jgi:uncharacterized membrane protein YdjX (TVP38/TMEM64 family)
MISTAVALLLCYFVVEFVMFSPARTFQGIVVRSNVHAACIFIVLFLEAGAALWHAIPATLLVGVLYVFVEHDVMLFAASREVNRGLIGMTQFCHVLPLAILSHLV